MIKSEQYQTNYLGHSSTTFVCLGEQIRKLFIFSMKPKKDDMLRNCSTVPVGMSLYDIKRSTLGPSRRRECNRQWTKQTHHFRV